MFIKKDERKIPNILADAKDSDDKGKLTDLRLARRPAEFNGSISILCQPHYANSNVLNDLKSLSLYDCQISNLDGISFFSKSKQANDGHGNGNADQIMERLALDGSHEETNIAGDVVSPYLAELNLGRNPLTDLPLELSALGRSLTSLWMDDCEISGPLPECIYHLDQLEILRVSNNRITKLNGGDSHTRGIVNLKKMKVLCLDGNLLEDVPTELADLTKLESLLIRKNKLTTLPEGVPGKSHTNLTLLHISSNQLTSLPKSLRQCPSIQSIYANANSLTFVPKGVSESLTKLESFNLSNNQIGTLDNEFIHRFGEPDVKSGICNKDSACTIQLDQNPIVESKRNVESTPEKDSDGDIDMTGESSE